MREETTTDMHNGLPASARLKGVAGAAPSKKTAIFQPYCSSVRPKHPQLGCFDVASERGPKELGA